MNIYVYEYKNNLYFNLTNKCSNRCVFCIRNGEKGELYEKGLWLDKEPETLNDIINQLPADLSKYESFVFCGYGEPTCNLEMLKQVANFLKQFNKPIRLNTNGQGNLINDRNIVPELKDCVDIVSISLNASNAEKYQKMCNSDFAERAYFALLEFGRMCQSAGIATKVTVVDLNDEKEITRCKGVCERNMLDLDIRDYEA